MFILGEEGRIRGGGRKNESGSWAPILEVDYMWLQGSVVIATKHTTWPDLVNII